MPVKIKRLMHLESTSSLIGLNSVLTIVATCSAGERTSGDGFWIPNGPRENVQLVTSLGLNGNDWTVIIRNNNFVVNTHITVQAGVYCISVTP